MSVALWLLDAAETLRGMARDYTEDNNDVHLLTHGAIVILLRQRTFHAPPTEAALAAALTVSAQELAEAEEATPLMVSPRFLEWTSPGP
ncbi:MAG: hypothetical protein QM759_15550 [Terricaulis sp.]